MKAFYEWFHRDIQPRIDARDTSVHKCDFKHGWRAALEHIINQMNTNKFMDNGELRTFIEQELEEN